MLATSIRNARSLQNPVPPISQPSDVDTQDMLEFGHGVLDMHAMGIPSHATSTPIVETPTLVPENFTAATPLPEILVSPFAVNVISPPTLLTPQLSRVSQGGVFTSPSMWRRHLLGNNSLPIAPTIAAPPAVATPVTPAVATPITPVVSTPIDPAIITPITLTIQSVAPPPTLSHGTCHSSPSPSPHTHCWNWTPHPQTYSSWRASRTAEGGVISIKCRGN